MGEAVIQIEGVRKHFGKNVVLDGLSFDVPKGKTFAFLGRNGAGKTTTILMLLGLLRPDAGRVSVLGLDPRREAVDIRQRVGYVAEGQVMFGWMRVEEIIRFLEPFYATWDDDLARRLVQEFELPMKTKVHHLSKGQNSRLALLLALAHRPELAILDDPTLGLDPIMRKDFLRDVVEHLQGSGTTVFFSSHLLYEIEPVADMIAILDHGRIVRQAETERLRAEVKELILPLSVYENLTELPGELDVKRAAEHVAVVVADVDAAQTALASAGVRPHVRDLNLDEIFTAYVIGRTHEERPVEPAVERVA